MIVASAMVLERYTNVVVLELPKEIVIAKAIS